MGTALRKSANRRYLAGYNALTPLRAGFRPLRWPARILNNCSPYCAVIKRGLLGAARSRKKKRGQPKEKILEGYK